MSDFNTEGVCRVPTTAGKTNAPVTALTFPDKKYTLTSIQYSKPLASVVAIAQNIKDDEGLTSTTVVQANPKSSRKEWPVIVDLGKSVGSLHQTTISTDGRYLMVLLSMDTTDYPVENLVTVDLVAKKEVNRIVLKQPKAWAPLALIAC
jgi:hypothetical protein